MIEAYESESDEEYDSQEDAHYEDDGHEDQYDDNEVGDDGFDDENEDHDPLAIAYLNQVGKPEYYDDHEKDIYACGLDPDVDPRFLNKFNTVL